MTLPADPPKLPKWPFLLADLGLLAAAWFIAARSEGSPTGAPLFAAVGCVVLGAFCAVIPFVAEYARRQEEAVDERQRALETLSRTVAASAEQIGIAASGLHEIAEIVQRNLKSADHLPHKLQEKISEFKAQLDNAVDEEKEELEKELATLRASESERLETTADKIAKATADWAKLEAAAHKHLIATQEALPKAATTAEQAVEKIRTHTVSAIDEKITAVVGELDRKLAQLTNALDAKVAALEAAANAFARPPASTASSAAEATQPRSGTAHVENGSSPPSRKANVPSATSAESHEADAMPAQTAPTSRERETASAATPPPADDPAASPAALDEATPAITAERAVPETEEIAPTLAAVPTAVETPKPESVRKRAPRKARTDAPAETGLSLAIEEPPAEATSSAAESEEFSQVADEAASERSVSADGLTRVVVTAYIGIGNRLFIRGEGPGLSWDKGVPLQFVSIGKWRWETADATAPVTFKLYKNDSTECSGLGSQSIAPGQQAEVTATF